MDINLVCNIAEQLKGLPFKEGGRDENGIDCVGLVLLFYKKIGIEIPYNDSHIYKIKRYLCGHQDILLEECKKYFHVYYLNDTKVNYRNITPVSGDLLIFQHLTRSITSHLGILITPHKFLHVEEEKGSRISQFSFNPYIDSVNKQNNWIKRLIAFGKVKKFNG